MLAREEESEEEAGSDDDEARTDDIEAAEINVGKVSNSEVSVKEKPKEKFPTPAKLDENHDVGSESNSIGELSKVA